MSTRKKVAVVTASLLAGFLTGGAALYVALFRAPAFYTAALHADVEPEMRKTQAKRFVQTTLQLVDGIRHESHWKEEFTEEQVNSWIAEELHDKYAEWLPHGVSHPRVQFESDSLSIAFQVQRTLWSGVVSVRLKPWVAEPNQLAVEVQSVRAGLIPIPLDDILAEISAELEGIGWRLHWKQLRGNDVLVVNLSRESGDQPVLESVHVSSKVLTISGSRKALAEFLRPQADAALQLAKLAGQR